jgi:hypothetical protein
LGVKEMLPSFHDCYLIAYEVECEARAIKLRIRTEDNSVSTVSFSGVEGYSFENDASGNLILSLEQVLVANLLSEFGPQISESYRMSGAPGPWANNIESAESFLMDKGASGFILSSSYGMSGWVLASEASVAQQGAQKGRAEDSTRFS